MRIKLLITTASGKSYSSKVVDRSDEQCNKAIKRFGKREIFSIELSNEDFIIFNPDHVSHIEVRYGT